MEPAGDCVRSLCVVAAVVDETVVHSSGRFERAGKKSAAENGLGKSREVGVVCRHHRREVPAGYKRVKMSGLYRRGRRPRVEIGRNRLAGGLQLYRNCIL